MGLGIGLHCSKRYKPIRWLINYNNSETCVDRSLRGMRRTEIVPKREIGRDPVERQSVSKRGLRKFLGKKSKPGRGTKSPTLTLLLKASKKRKTLDPIT